MSVDVETMPPGYYNVIEYVVADGVSRFAVEANCPCGCGHGIWLPITGPGIPKTDHNWTWDGNKAQPTLSPSIRRIGGCAFHGYLQGGAWSSAGDGAPLSPQVYRGGPDHPIEPRRELMPSPKPAPAPAPAPAVMDRAPQAPTAMRPAPAPAPAAAAAAHAPSPAQAALNNRVVDVVPAGYGPTPELRFAGTKLQQKYASGNDSSRTVWVQVEGQ